MKLAELRKEFLHYATRFTEPASMAEVLGLAEKRFDEAIAEYTAIYSEQLTDKILEEYELKEKHD